MDMRGDTKMNDDDEIAYFTVRWKTRELVLSTAPNHQDRFVSCQW